VSSDIELRKIAAAILTLANVMKSNTSAIKEQTSVLKDQNRLMQQMINTYTPPLINANYFGLGGSHAQEGPTSPSGDQESQILSRGEARRLGGFGEEQETEAVGERT
jgi:hypothetical protein